MVGVALSRISSTEGIGATVQVSFFVEMLYIAETKTRQRHRRLP